MATFFRVNNMETYKNRTKKSGVLAYEIGTDFIKIEFVGGDVYVYDYTKPGKIKVEEMKRLARAGKGLSTYISRYVRENYSRKG